MAACSGEMRSWRHAQPPRGGVLHRRRVRRRSRGGARRCRAGLPGDESWSGLARHGVTEDPGTWTELVVRIACPEGGPFAEAGTRPALWEAFDQLIGAGRWWRRPGVGGTIPVRFPSLHAGVTRAGTSRPATSETGSSGSTSTRGPAGCWCCTCSATSTRPARRPGSVPGRTGTPPGCSPRAGTRDSPWLEAATAAADASAGRATALAVGQAGDVFLCHPFLVHAASWPHRGRIPRMMAQPGVAVHTQFPLAVPLRACW